MMLKEFVFDKLLVFFAFMEQLESAGKDSRISGCKDSSISTSKPVIDLVDAIKPGAIDYTLVLDGASEEVIV